MRFAEETLLSWGRTLRAPQHAATVAWQDEAPALLREGIARTGHVLARGMGRSYGDCGLNPGGAVLVGTALDRLIAFDPASRRLRAEAGITIAALLRFLLPRGFFLPVVPGTSLVSLGGAVANDVHGKNHGSAGTFGRWVRAIGLLRSDGTEHTLDAADPTGLFAATIGGLGLTGFIRWVEIEVIPIPGPAVETRTIAYGSLEDGLALARAVEPGWAYDVAWVDCNAPGAAAGRGLLMLGRHAAGGSVDFDVSPRFELPFDAPGWLLNRHVSRAFAAFYFALGRRGAGRTRLVPAGPYFFQLDRIGRWNRLYGGRGFFQHQCVLPWAAAGATLRAMLRALADAGDGCPLAVQKAFGVLPSPGLMSFPREGVTLTLDLRNRGQETDRLLARLDALVVEAGGRLYPAKDARMTPATFRAGYPQWERFAAFVDPAFSSAFWRRVTA